MLFHVSYIMAKNGTNDTRVCKGNKSYKGELHAGFQNSHVTGIIYDRRANMFLTASSKVQVSKAVSWKRFLWGFISEWRSRSDGFAVCFFQSFQSNQSETDCFCILNIHYFHNSVLHDSFRGNVIIISRFP